MDWYYILLIILGVILLSFFITCYVSYRITFYSGKKKEITDEIKIPNISFYTKYKDIIIRDIKDVRTYEYTKMSIKSFDGLTLTGKYYENIKGAPIEIMFHGYRGSAELDLSTGVKRAFSCKHNVLLINQRGSIGSEGHVTTFGINESKDCVSWVNHIVKTFGEDVKIFIGGVSMGAATVLMAASMDLPKNVKAVVADCGFDEPGTIIKKVMKDMKLPIKVFYPIVKLSAKLFGKFNLEEFSPYESVKKAKLPIIFIHGDEDGLVPCEMSVKMYEACVSDKHLLIVKGADHGVSYLVEPEKYVNELTEFTNKYI